MTAIPISDEGGVTYQELVDLERDFDDVETEIIRHQHSLTIPLYTRRAEILARIPNFWPLVFEAAPPDIDEFIQPSDSALLLASLNALSVSRFELEADPKNGDPRSVAIRFEFSENEYFEDKVLEKKFWFRRGGDEGWSGLVSEPVDIKWKKGKDLTNGLLGMVRKVWEKWVAEAPKNVAEAEKTKGKSKKKEKKALSAEEQALQTKMSETALGGLSFFAWFGYVGPRVTATESKAATAKLNEERRLRKEGKEVPEEENDEDEDEDEDEEMDEDEEDDDEDSLEIFPEGDGLALAISEDLWPGAIKYFTQAQEQVMSDVDFESDLEEGDGAEDDGEDEPPALKKRKV